MAVPFCWGVGGNQRGFGGEIGSMVVSDGEDPAGGKGARD